MCKSEPPAASNLIRSDRFEVDHWISPPVVNRFLAINLQPAFHHLPFWCLYSRTRIAKDISNFSYLIVTIFLVPCMGALPDLWRVYGGTKRLVTGSVVPNDCSLSSQAFHNCVMNIQMLSEETFDRKKAKPTCISQKLGIRS